MFQTEGLCNYLQDKQLTKTFGLEQPVCALKRIHY